MRKSRGANGSSLDLTNCSASIEPLETKLEPRGHAKRFSSHVAENYFNQRASFEKSIRYEIDTNLGEQAKKNEEAVVKLS